MIIKKFIYLLILLGILYGMDRIYFHVTGDFRLANITYPLLPFKEGAFSSLTESEKEELNRLFEHPFSFLGKGNQSYAFESYDKKYVLKFFKLGHLKPRWFQSEMNESQKKRLKKVFEGYDLASQYDRENCGLLFVHLHKTNTLKKVVTVKDWFGFSHTIDLDEVVFAVQQKLTPARTVLSEDLSNGNLDQAKRHIHQLFTLYLSEYAKGIYDRDHNVMDNIGYTENHAMHIDLGKLRYDERVKEKNIYLKDLRKIALERIDKWVHKYYPQFEKEIKEFIHQELSTAGCLISH